MPTIRIRTSFLRSLRLAMALFFHSSTDRSLLRNELSFSPRISGPGELSLTAERVGNCISVSWMTFRAFRDAMSNLHCRDNHGRDAAAWLGPMTGEIKILHQAVKRRTLFAELVGRHFPT